MLINGLGNDNEISINEYQSDNWYLTNQGS